MATSEAVAGRNRLQPPAQIFALRLREMRRLLNSDTSSEDDLLVGHDSR